MNDKNERYLLCVTDQANWKVIKSKKIWGVSERFKNQIMMLGRGDNLVFYVKPRKICGIFKAISKPFQEKALIFKGKAYPYRVRLKPVVVLRGYLEFRPLVDKLRFITKKHKWGTHLQGRAMRFIPKEDFELIRKELERLEKSAG